MSRDIPGDERANGGSVAGTGDDGDAVRRGEADGAEPLRAGPLAFFSSGLGEGLRKGLEPGGVTGLEDEIPGEDHASEHGAVRGLFEYFGSDGPVAS